MTKTILVVDDEEYIVDLLATLLEDEHYRIMRAYDGVQALQSARREHPQLIITDVMMPKLNGAEMIRQLRAQGDLPNGTPVILMSAVNYAHQLPHATFLAKPFELEHVLWLVRQLLARSGDPQPGRELYREEGEQER